VKYSPSGDLFASVGSDGKLFIYDGKTGEIIVDVPEGHTGTAVSFEFLHLHFLLSWSGFGMVKAGGSVRLWSSTPRYGLLFWYILLFRGS